MEPGFACGRRAGSCGRRRGCHPAETAHAYTNWRSLPCSYISSMRGNQMSETNITNDKPWSELVLEFLSVCVFSVVVGVGIGTIQGYFAFFLTNDLPEVLWQTAAIGLIVGLLAGLVIHYFVLKRKTRFADVTRIVAVTAIVGAITGLLLNRLTHGEGGWLSLFFTIIAAVLISVWQRRGMAHASVPS
jgi:small basic protein